MSKSTSNNNGDKGIEGHLNFAEGSYLESTSRPLYALFFLLPLIAVYEFGSMLVGHEQIAEAQLRVVAFTWLIELAKWIGMHRSLAWVFPGLVVVIILLCWQMSSGYPWRIKLRWFGWMTVECIVLSVPLVALGALQSSSNNIAAIAGRTLEVSSIESNSYLANIVISIGAGIYEELVFRLIILGLLIMLMEDVLKVRAPFAAASAVLISAILFAAHHYVGVLNGRVYELEELRFGSFFFRTAAGIYLAILFRHRGYGITAGTHSVYNIIFFTFAVN